MFTPISQSLSPSVRETYLSQHALLHAWPEIPDWCSHTCSHTRTQLNENRMQHDDAHGQRSYGVASRGERITERAALPATFVCLEVFVAEVLCCHPINLCDSVPWVLHISNTLCFPLGTTTDSRSGPRGAKADAVRPVTLTSTVTAGASSLKSQPESHIPLGKET